MIRHRTTPLTNTDGAYDGEPVYRAVAEHQPGPPAAVVIPPRASAVPSPTADTAPSGLPVAAEPEVRFGVLRRGAVT